MAIGGRSAIIRTSWVYDGVGKNFFTTMMNKAHEGAKLSIVDDQIGRPTYAGHLAEACMEIILKPVRKPRIYHVQNSGDPITWFDFAMAIFEEADIEADAMPVSSENFPTPAMRPKYSVLDTTDFELAYSHHIPSWDVGIKAAFEEYTKWRSRS